MGDAAVKSRPGYRLRGARARGVSADARGEFFFMEMNTALAGRTSSPPKPSPVRILVAWPMRVAPRRELRLTQRAGAADGARHRGCRCTPKITDNDFSPGQRHPTALSRRNAPARAPRATAALPKATSSRLSTIDDAKLIAWGETRGKRSALVPAGHAARDRVAGVQTNLEVILDPISGPHAYRPPNWIPVLFRVIARAIVARA